MENLLTDLTNSWPGFVHLLVSFPELLFVLVISHNMNLINTCILLAKIFLVWMRNLISFHAVLQRKLQFFWFFCPLSKFWAVRLNSGKSEREYQSFYVLLIFAYFLVFSLSLSFLLLNASHTGASCCWMKQVFHL